MRGETDKSARARAVIKEEPKDANDKEDVEDE